VDDKLLSTEKEIMQRRLIGKFMMLSYQQICSMYDRISSLEEIVKILDRGEIENAKTKSKLALDEAKASQK
jgi:hypothetical protein